MKDARVFHDATSDVRVNRWRETLGLLTSKIPSSPTDFQSLARTAHRRVASSTRSRR